MKYRIFLFAILAVVFTSCNSGQASVDHKQKVECNEVDHHAHDHVNAEVSTKSEINTAGISGHDCGNCSEKSTCSDVVPSKTKDKDILVNHKSAASESHGSTPCTGHDH